jgi:hypothetical protein
MKAVHAHDLREAAVRKLLQDKRFVHTDSIKLLVEAGLVFPSKGALMHAIFCIRWSLQKNRL